MPLPADSVLAGSIEPPDWLSSRADSALARRYLCTASLPQPAAPTSYGSYRAETRAQAVHWLAYFADNYHRYPSAVRCLLEHQADLLTCFDFPKEHWRHIKTTNPIESPFAPVKSRIRRAKRLLRHWSALGLVYQLLMDQQTRWFRLTAPHLAADVIAGARYCDGIEIKPA
jgi:putative transposase